MTDNSAALPTTADGAWAPVDPGATGAVPAWNATGIATERAAGIGTGTLAVAERALTHGDGEAQVGSGAQADGAMAPLVVAGGEEAHRSRSKLIAGISAGVLTLVIVGVSLHGAQGGPGSYAAVDGPAGSPVVVAMPESVDQYADLMDDLVPLWTYQQALLPSGAGSSYATVTGMFTDATGNGFDVDVLYAVGDAGHRGVLSEPPTAVAKLMGDELGMSGVVDEPTMSGGGGGAGVAVVVRCGSYGFEPLCIWADQSTVGFVRYSGVSGSTRQLAAET